MSRKARDKKRQAKVTTWKQFTYGLDEETEAENLCAMKDASFASVSFLPMTTTIWSVLLREGGMR